MAAAYLTVGEIAAQLGLPPWKVRRAIDALKREVPRAGLYRLVPHDYLPLVEAALRRRGVLPARAEEDAS